VFSRGVEKIIVLTGLAPVFVKQSRFALVFGKQVAPVLIKYFALVFVKHFAPVIVKYFAPVFVKQQRLALS
jgi:hypothetical protein